MVDAHPAEPFALRVETVFQLTGRGSVVVGPILSGVIRSGDRIDVVEGGEVVVSAQAQVEFIDGSGVASDSIALVLGDVEPQLLRRGQLVRHAREPG